MPFSEQSRQLPKQAEYRIHRFIGSYGVAHLQTLLFQSFLVITVFVVLSVATVATVIAVMSSPAANVASLKLTGGW
jgi:hypothetical protein